MLDIIIDFDWKAIEKMEADFNEPISFDFNWNSIIELEKPFDFNFDFVFDTITEKSVINKEINKKSGLFGHYKKGL